MFFALRSSLQWYTAMSNVTSLDFYSSHTCSVHTHSPACRRTNTLQPICLGNVCKCCYFLQSLGKSMRDKLEQIIFFSIQTTTTHPTSASLYSLYLLFHSNEYDVINESRKCSLTFHRWTTSKAAISIYLVRTKSKSSSEFSCSPNSGKLHILIALHPAQHWELVSAYEVIS